MHELHDHPHLASAPPPSTIMDGLVTPSVSSSSGSSLSPTPLLSKSWSLNLKAVH
jgi:hypothetical protein